MSWMLRGSNAVVPLDVRANGFGPGHMQSDNLTDLNYGSQLLHSANCACETGILAREIPCWRPGLSSAHQSTDTSRFAKDIRIKLGRILTSQRYSNAVEDLSH